MKIITKKQEEEIEFIKKQNEYWARGYKAISRALDYQNAIGAILRTLNITEIEIDNRLLSTQFQIETERTPFNTTKIRLLKEE